MLPELEVVAQRGAERLTGVEQHMLATGAADRQRHLLNVLLDALRIVVQQKLSRDLNRFTRLHVFEESRTAVFRLELLTIEQAVAAHRERIASKPGAMKKTKDQRRREAHPAAFTAQATKFSQTFKRSFINQ